MCPMANEFYEKLIIKMRMQRRDIIDLIEFYNAIFLNSYTLFDSWIILTNL